MHGNAFATVDAQVCPRQRKRHLPISTRGETCVVSSRDVEYGSLVLPKDPNLPRAVFLPTPRSKISEQSCCGLLTIFVIFVIILGMLGLLSHDTPGRG